MGVGNKDREEVNKDKEIDGMIDTNQGLWQQDI
jgi:hypothetical protein